MRHYYDEFSLGVRYRKPGAGSYPRPDVPGFYVYAGFANAGEADWLIEDRLLSSAQFTQIGAELATALDVPRLGTAVATAAIEAEEAQAKQLDRLREARVALDAKIAALEAVTLARSQA